MRRLGKLLCAALLLSCLPLGCGRSGGAPPAPPDVPTTGVYVELEVHRASLAVTDAFYMTTTDILVPTPVVIGRGGRSLLLVSALHAAPLALGTNADLMVGRNATLHNAWIGGAEEDGQAVIRALVGDPQWWYSVEHSVPGDLTGADLRYVCTDEGAICYCEAVTSQPDPVFQAPAGVRLRAVHQSRVQPGRVIAVGDDGAIFHRHVDGGPFHDESIPGGPDFVAIEDAQPISLDDPSPWIVGDNQIWQFFDGAWRQSYTEASQTLNDIALIDEGLIIAVGNAGLVVVHSLLQWRESTLDESIDLKTIAASNGEALLVGKRGETYERVLNSWQRRSYDAHAPWVDLCVTSDDEVYGVQRNRILHFAGTEWQDFAAWDMAGDFTALHVLDPTHVWALGIDESGIDHFVLFFDGSDWTILKHASLDGFTDLWVDSAGDEVWVADQAGLIWRRHEDAWAVEYDLGFGRQVVDFSGTTSANLLGVGPDGLILRRGFLGWDEEDSGTTMDLHAGDGPYVVGQDGLILLREEGAWAPVGAAAGADLHAILYRAANDVWAVGDDATLLRFEGAEWTQLVTHTPGVHFLSIVGQGEDDIWFGGTEGWLLRHR